MAAIGRAVSWRASPSTRPSPRLLAPMLALIGAIYGVILVLGIVLLLTPPRLSLVLAVPVSGQAQVAWVMPGGTLWGQGVRAGDAVLALDGHRPTREDAGSWAGRRLRVRTALQGTIIVDAQAQSSQAVTWPLLVLSPWFLLLGTLIALQAMQRSVGRAAYTLLASAAFALALAIGADSDNVAATVLEWSMVGLFAYSFPRFFLVFPIARGTFRLRALLLAPPLLGVLIGVASLHWPVLYATGNVLRLSVELAYLVAGIGLLVSSFIRISDLETRQQLTLMGGGMVVSILPFVTLVLVPSVVGRPPIVPAEQAILALGLLPLSFAYAILRHGMLNVHLLQRWLVYGVLGATLLVIGAIAVSVLGLLLDAPQPEAGHRLAGVAVLAVALLAGMIVSRLHGRVQSVLDRLIFKDVYDYSASLQQLSHDVSLAGDLNVLGASLPATLRRLMNLDFAVLLVHRADGEMEAYGAAGRYQPAMLPALAAGTRDTQELPRIVLLADNASPVLLVPLRAQEVVAGHLCLGPKLNGEPFRPRDIDLLTTLSGHLAAIIHNAQLADDLRAQVCLLSTLTERLQRAHEEERAKLAADLHDEPLQTAYHLQSRLLADVPGLAATIQHTRLAQALINQLHSICTAVRPAALDELGLAAAIEELALDRAAHADVRIRLDLGADLAGSDLSSGAELVLYRAAQETLMNSLRHAQPRTIDVSLQRYPCTVRLRVRDDGIGFVAPEHVDDLSAAGHLGLMGMHYRVQRAGGYMTVASALGVGTTVQVELPLGRVPS